MEATVPKKSSYLPVGFAIFSMFFGAGNSIFPLLIGSQAGNQNLYAVLGMAVSSILVPLLGVFGLALFDGNYKEFFCRLGKMPGLFIIALIMLLIGPFAGIPRCITLSYSTLKPHLGGLSLVFFSALACVMIFFKAVKKNRLVDILGKFLTPLLLLCLSVIIIKGLMAPGVSSPSSLSLSNGGVFKHGLIKGFQMMDLLASFFFSATVISCLKVKTQSNKAPKEIFLKAGALAGLLLFLIYVGFSYVAAKNSAYFRSFDESALLAAVGHKILGNSLGFVMGFMVSLACLTTAITLVGVFSEYLHKEIFSQKISYIFCVLSTIVVAFCFSNLGFMGICNMIAPVLLVCYPALITLTCINIFHKLYGYKQLKWPVYSVLGLSILFKVI